MADAAITDQMAVPRAILPESGLEVTHLEKGGVTWTSRKGGAPSILVGFASIIPTEKVRLKQILIFRVTEKGAKVFNNVEPAEDDPVKWTRVSRCRVQEWDDAIIFKAGEVDPGEDQEARIVDWLSSHYRMHKDTAAIQLGKQHEEKEVKKGVEAGKRPRQPFHTKSQSKRRGRKVMTARKPVKANKASAKASPKITRKVSPVPDTADDCDYDFSGSSLFGGADSGYGTGDSTPDC